MLSSRVSPLVISSKHPGASHHGFDDTRVLQRCEEIEKHQILLRVSMFLFRMRRDDAYASFCSHEADCDWQILSLTGDGRIVRRLSN